MTMRILLVGNGQAHQVAPSLLGALSSGVHEYAFVDESRYFSKITTSWLRLESFEEGKEVSCFETNEELIAQTRYYLKHDLERRRMAEAAYPHVWRGRHTYRDWLAAFLEIAEAHY
jgi:hypothetical protein